MLSNVNLALNLLKACVALFLTFSPLAVMLVYAQYPRGCFTALLPHLFSSFEDWSKAFSEFLILKKKCFMSVCVYLSVFRDLF